MQKTHSHIFYTLLAIWLIAVLALTVTACGRAAPCPVCGEPSNNHICCSAAPCPVCGAAYVCDCAVAETVTEEIPATQQAAVQAAKEAAEEARPAIDAAEPSIQTETTTSSPAATPAAPQNLTLEYRLVSAFSDSLASAHFLPPNGMTDWEYIDSMGQKAVAYFCSDRPCSMESTSVIKISRVKDGLITLSLPMQKYLDSYTVTAYPIGHYDAASGTVLDAAGDAFRLSESAMYYEIVVKYTSGTVTYGFFTE